jgi:hypothetical protein
MKLIGNKHMGVPNIYKSQNTYFMDLKEKIKRHLFFSKAE